MCGICGFTGFEDKDLLKRMCDVVKHRGPDDEGSFIGNNVNIGMRRLSIIDLKTGHQPIHNEDETIWVVNNGEIYNFQELREVLEGRGHRFYTNSDTEVIVHAYEEYGRGCVNYFKGMFSLAVWDSNKKLLFIARDRTGIKPLYYCFFKGSLFFASEVKSILQHTQIPRRVNKQALYYMLNLRFTPNPLTLFDGINMLPPAHTLTYKDNKITIKKYWSLPEIESERNEAYYIKKLRSLIEKSVERHLISDVPLGVFLSGGIDSSTIAAYASKLSDSPVKTFTVEFGEETDEIEDAQRIADAFETEHHRVVFDDEDMSQLLPKLIWHVEEPRLNIFQEYMVSQFASKHVKVGLGGLGGDELFAGYEHLEFINAADRVRKLYPLPNFFTDKLVDSIMGASKKTISKYELYKRICFALSLNNRVSNY